MNPEINASNEPASATQPQAAPTNQAVAPAAPEAPYTAPPNPVVAPVQPATSPVAPPASSRKGLFAGAAVAVAAIIVATLGWFLLWSPQAQAKRLSNSFMHNITSGDVDKAVAQTGDSSAKDFLTNASKSVHGSYTLSQSKFTDGKGYYLYSLSGADKKYARTIIEKDNGKRVVHSFVYSNTSLALVPSSSTSNNDTQTNVENTPTKTASSAQCLTPADFSYFSNLGQPTPELNSGMVSDFYQMQFSPDAATYLPDGIPDPTTVYNDFKNFYAQDSNKKFAIELEASVNSASPATQLANARNAKVQSDLETISGIPASKISIQPLTNGTSNDGGDQFYRQVQITLRSDDSCSTIGQN